MSERTFGTRAFRARSAIGVPLAYAAAAVGLGVLVPRLERDRQGLGLSRAQP
jgi:hypothetical protein